MKSYYVLFELQSKIICGTYGRANSKEEAIMNAVFAITCYYPYVKYDKCYITAVKD